MTTHDKDKIIAAAKEAGFPEWENTDDPEFLKVIEKLYVVAFQSGTASRGAEIAELVAVLELLSKYIAYNGDDWVQRTALEALAKVRKP